MANEFLSPIGKGDKLKDYSHASKIFVDDNYRLAPKHGFLFHVAFSFGSIAKQLNANHKLEAGMLVKSADLPSFDIDRKTLVAYNRKNEVHTRVNYKPVNLTFHDDTANVILSLWNAYYQHYFKDMISEHTTYKDAHKYHTRVSTRWGYEPEDDPFFTAIKIYSLSQKQFTEYTLINPIIDSFKHGRHDMSDGGKTMEHEMSIAYELVRYRTGVTSANTVDGFATLHYDNVPSPLGATTANVSSGPIPNGANVGGTLSNIAGSLLQGAVPGSVAGAVSGGLSADALSNLAKSEIKSMGKDLLAGRNPTARYNFPNALNTIKGNALNMATNKFNEAIDPAVDKAWDAIKNSASQVGRASNGVTSNGSVVGQNSKPSGQIARNWIDPDVQG